MKLSGLRRQHYPHAAGTVRRHHKVILGVCIAAALLSITSQLAYPRDRALPMAELNGRIVGYTLYDELVRQTTADFEASRFKVTAGDASAEESLPHAGAELEAELVAGQLNEYPLWQRLVPFSMVFLHPRADTIKVTFNAEQLRTTAEALAKQLSRPPKDAKLAIVDGKLEATASKPGLVVEADALASTLEKSRFKFGTTMIAAPSRQQEPVLKDADIAPIRAQAEAAINRAVVLVSQEGEEFRPEPAMIAGWLTITPGEDGALQLGVDAAQVGAYLAAINNKVGVSPVAAKVTLVDSEETGRVEGEAGDAIATGQLTASIEQVLLNPAASSWIAVPMKVVPPPVTYHRSYTSSLKGLTAYVDYITTSEDVRIALRQVDGNGWSAQGRATEQLPAASTYKLYVSYLLFSQINSGKWQWSDRMLGTDASGCFERMIVVSDNACAEKFIDMYGRKDLNEFLYGKGFSQATTFTSREATQTSAADLEKLLMGIETSSMVSGNDRATLLDKMGRQVYRRGIPAGSGGRVDDKVGFLWDYLHDAAIVRHPKGTYVVAIMTKNSSWGRIAEITKELEKIMYP